MQPDRWGCYGRKSSGTCAIIPGPRTFRTLINHCGSAGAALQALPDFSRRGGAGRAVRICPRTDAEQELAAAAHGVTFLALGEDEYPAQLATIDDAPQLLVVRGQPAALHEPMIGMVGSRNASAERVGLAFQFSSGLTDQLSVEIATSISMLISKA